MEGVAEDNLEKIKVAQLKYLGLIKEEEDKEDEKQNEDTR